MKKLAVLTVMVLLVFGCAVTKVRDTVPEGSPKGFVKFYVMMDDLVKYHQMAPNIEIYSNGVHQGSWPRFNPAWSRKDRLTMMVSKTPGVHRFSVRRFSIHSEAMIEDFKVAVEEGMITPVKISFASAEKDISINPNVSLETTQLRFKVIIEKAVPMTK